MRHDPTDYFTNTNNFSRVFLQEFHTTSSKTRKKLADLHFNFVSAQLENTCKQLMLYTPVADHRQWLSGVSALTSQYGDEVLGLTRKVNTVLAAYRAEVIALLDKGFIATDKAEKTPAKRYRKSQ